MICDSTEGSWYACGKTLRQSLASSVHLHGWIVEEYGGIVHAPRAGKGGQNARLQQGPVSTLRNAKQSSSLSHVSVESSKIFQNCCLLRSSTLPRRLSSIKTVEAAQHGKRAIGELRDYANESKRYR
jgi:hypothetical protein